MEAIKQIGIGAIRTLVPHLVGQILTWLTVFGIVDTTGSMRADLISALMALFTVVYYILVRVLEQWLSKKFGWLLGYASVPEYKN